MRGLISFVLVMLVIESVLLMHNDYLLHIREEMGNEHQMLALQDFYYEKMIIKRKIQNTLAEPSDASNVFEKIEEAAARLEELEAEVESQKNADVDIWCGYVDSSMLDETLYSFKQGNFNKLPPIFDASDKIVIITDNGEEEIHACSMVLVYDYDAGKVKIGRNHMQQAGFDEDFSLLKPVIGISISNGDGMYDVDYVDVIE